MAHSHRPVRPGQSPATVVAETGENLTPPANWEFLPAGDAAITRSVKAVGATWVVQVRKGRREITLGIWAAAAHIAAARQEVAARRSSPDYARTRARELARRETRQQAYVKEFFAEVVRFLDFHPRHRIAAQRLGELITAHATPIGSGTVARTERIPLARRAEAAVIAWMRHRTTAYESMRIARIKGRRREVRRQLAAESVAILQTYRQGLDIAESCPLKRALGKERKEPGIGTGRQ